VSRPYQACAPDVNRLIERSREEEKDREGGGASKKGRKTEGARGRGINSYLGLAYQVSPSNQVYPDSCLQNFLDSRF